MKNHLIALTLLLLTISCRKDDLNIQNACTAANPLDVQWVKNLIKPLAHCSCTVTLFQGTYNGQPVYFTLINDPNCDAVFSAQLLDCLGKPVKTYSSSLQEMQAFQNEVTLGKPLYRCNP